MSLGIVFILILTVPSLAGMDLNFAGQGSDHGSQTSISTGPYGAGTGIWTKEIPIQLPKSSPTDQPWWETTSRDSNRNGIVDSLETGTEPTSDPTPIIISYSHPPGLDEIADLERLGISAGNVIEAIDAIDIGYTDPALVPALAALPGVVMVEPAGRLVLFSDVATPALKARESAEYSPYTAWELTNVTGYGINIAVVDTGIDDGHPSLVGKRVAGYDAVTPESREDGQTNPDDRNGHGTSCSGMATGTSAGDDPGLRYMGSAPGASLLDVQIGTDIGAGPFENYLLPTIYYDSAIRGIEWVRDNAHTEWSWVGPDHYGIDVMSLSWGIMSHETGGSDGSDPFSRVIDEVVDEGVVCVGAAGNDGPSNDGFNGMSASTKALIIGATNDLNTVDRTDDIIASYSSRGPRKDNNDGYPYDELKPDVSAPGTNIWNTDPCTTSEGCYGDADGNGYEARGSGTSYATPAVAGVVALILDVNANLTPAQVKGVLHQTSERRGPASIPELDPFWNRDFGYGMVDAYEAVKLAMELNDMDLDTLDVELQAHITNTTGGASGKTVIQGLAWAKAGSLDLVEISIDGGPWKEVQYEEPLNGSVGAGEYVIWMYTVSGSELSEDAADNHHTAMVRTVGEGGGAYSLHDSASFFAKADSDDDDGISTTQVAFLSALVLLALFIVIFFVMGSRQHPEDEIEEAMDIETVGYDE